MRYGLLDYLIWVVFLGSAIAALLNSERWEIFAPLAAKGENINLVTFSKDERYVAMILEDRKLRLLSFPSMKLVWESALPQQISFNYIDFRTDGSEVLVQGSSGSSLGRKLCEIHGKVSNGATEIVLVDYFDRGALHSSFLSANGEFLLRKYSKMDEFGAVVFHARYPDGWIGQLYRPEVIATLIAGLALIYRIIRIRLSKG